MRSSQKHNTHDSRFFADGFVSRPFALFLCSQVNRLGLPVTEAEARLLVVEYGGAAAGGVCSNGDGEGQMNGGGEGQLSLDDFDLMVRRQSRSSFSRSIL